MAELILNADASHDDWLKVRNTGLGGSDCGSILGLNPYKSALTLWSEKTGMMQPEDLSKNERVWWGSHMEPVIAQRFEEITDKKVRRRGTLRDNDYPYMLANIDRWIVGENAGLEIKTADWRMSKQWGDKDDLQDMTVPDSYYCQCMHYMAVTGADYWYIGALIGGNDFRVKKIMRNEDDIKYIREQEKEFWNHVTEQTMPAVDGSDSTVHTLVGLYNTPNGKEIDLPEEALRIFEKYDLAKAKENEAKDAIQAAKNELMALLGENEVGHIGDRKVTWKATKPRESISLSRVKKEDSGSYEALKAMGFIKIGEAGRMMKVY